MAKLKVGDRLTPPKVDGRIAILIAVTEDERKDICADIAEAYAVEVHERIPGGCIIYGLYRGEWIANVSGRWLLTRFIVAGEKLRDNWDCGGDDWWAGCEAIKTILEGNGDVNGT